MHCLCFMSLGLQDGWERSLSQKMDQLELNCNANIGEAVAAGIEEVQASALAASEQFPLCTLSCLRLL